jgi:hypothetical protein
LTLSADIDKTNCACSETSFAAELERQKYFCFFAAAKPNTNYNTQKRNFKRFSYRQNSIKITPRQFYSTSKGFSTLWKSRSSCDSETFIQSENFLQKFVAALKNVPCSYSNQEKF